MSKLVIVIAAAGAAATAYIGTLWVVTVLAERDDSHERLDRPIPGLPLKDGSL